MNPRVWQLCKLVVVNVLLTIIFDNRWGKSPCLRVHGCAVYYIYILTLTCVDKLFHDLSQLVVHTGPPQFKYNDYIWVKQYKCSPPVDKSKGLGSLCHMMKLLQSHIMTKKSKNVDVLHMAEEVSLNISSWFLKRGFCVILTKQLLENDLCW